MKKREYEVGIELTDKKWKKLESLLPEPERSSKGGQLPAPNRACLEGLLWLLRSGARYKDMPKHFPSGSTCWRRLKWWYEQGALLDAWQKILGLLDKKSRLKWEEAYFKNTVAMARFPPHCACCRARHERGRSRWLFLISDEKRKRHENNGAVGRQRHAAGGDDRVGDAE